MYTQNKRKYLAFMALALAGLLFIPTAARAADWPTFRHDNHRSAVSEEKLEPPLSLQWTFVPPLPPEPAWPTPAKEKPRVRFDEVFHPAAAGGAVYFCTSSDDTLYCLDAASGAMKWRYTTGGPMRVAPTIDGGRVYAGSDDGHVYCLNADDGALLWKVRAGFRDDQLLGNGRMISVWPVRTGVLVEDGTAYFGAGVFPHESILLYAVNADDGSVLWCNDTCGETGYRLEFGGISPQGPMLASDTTVFVPSGRAMPAAFSKEDGSFLNYLSPGGKVGGTWALLTEDRLLAGIESKRAYGTERGQAHRGTAYAWFPGLHLVVQGDDAYMVTFDNLLALDRQAFQRAEQWRAEIDKERKPLDDRLKILKRMRRETKAEDLAKTDAQIAEIQKQVNNFATQQRRIQEAVCRWQRPCEQNDALILAGKTLYLGGQEQVAAATISTGREEWQAPVEGRACGLAVSNGRLLVSTDSGRIYCFAGGEGAGSTVSPPAVPSPLQDDPDAALITQAAEHIVAETGVTKGYCLVYGCGTGRLACELAKRTELTFVCIDESPQNVTTATGAFRAAGILGARATAHQGNLMDLPYADYFANLVVSETALIRDDAKLSMEELLRVQKPCGGILYIGRPEGAPATALDEQPGADVKTASGLRWTKLVRGALPGAGAWTHQYADASNTACSPDERVRGALGVLWYGQPGPQHMVERHARAAAPLAMDGRLFTQGEHRVEAHDAYNGVQLWVREIPGAVRVRVDSDMGNLAMVSDGLFVAAYDQCLRLDPVSGKTTRTFGLPDTGGVAKRWGYLACVETGNRQVLVGSVAKPLPEDYGEFQAALLDADDSWADLGNREDLPKQYRDYLNQLAAKYPEPDERAFWEAQQAGVMWRNMSPWPAWGSVATPKGAITQNIMASDIVFALDANSGETLWEYEGQAVAHPAIAIGQVGDGHLLFLADCNVSEEEKQAAMAEREALMEKGAWERAKTKYNPSDADVRRVIALDAVTGEKRWERIIDITGCGGDRMGLACNEGVLCFFGCFSNHDRNLFKDGKLEWRRVTAVAMADGADVWSRPLNYLRRPVLMEDEVIIEPRLCSLQTGEVKQRLHPLTGEESTWEFVRPGHCCSVTSACPNMFFLRGYFLWYYDTERDQGMLPFGGIRPGCWINTIPANGLVLFPEASAGCTCSYPIRSTVVLQPKEELKTWSVFVQNGGLTPVDRLAINLGAPGDWRDDGEETMWFAYPHPPSSSWYSYGVDFKLKTEFYEGKEYFCRNIQGTTIQGTDKPWVFGSGCAGLKSCKVPLLSEGQGAGRYTVRLCFLEQDGVAEGDRVFDVKLQGKTVLKNFDIVKEAGGAGVAVVKECTGIEVTDLLHIELVCHNETPERSQMPIINGMEFIREELKVAQGG